MEVGEPVAVVLRLHHAGEEIVGRIRRLAPQPDLRVEDLGELGERATDADPALGRVGLRPRAVQQLLAPVRDFGVLLARDAQGFGRHRDGEHGAEADHQVAAAGSLDRREELLGELARERLDFERGAGRERAVQQAPHAWVQRRIDLTEETLLFGYHHTRAPEALRRREPLCILERGRSVGVCRRVDEALHRPRHRALGAQALHEAPHVLRLRRVERVEAEVVAVAHAFSWCVVVLPVLIMYP